MRNFGLQMPCDARFHESLVRSRHEGTSRSVTTHKNKDAKLVYLSVGDDGGGPFAFARGIASGLFRQADAHGISLALVVEGWPGPRARGRQQGLIDSLTALLRQLKCAHRVEFNPRDRWLWLERDVATQWVDPVATKNVVLSRFRDRVASNYLATPPTELSSADLVIAVVDPCAIAAAWQQNRKAICVTDHTWDVTMRLVLEQVSLLDVDMQQITHFIGSLYAQADRLYMWPEPVTPDDPFFEGAQELGVEVRRLPGVLESPTMNRTDVQDVLNIDQGNRALPTVCLSSGALGALAGMFQRVFQLYDSVPPDGYNVVIDATINQCQQPVFQPGQLRTTMQWRPSLAKQCIAYNLLITRAGGGAVNSALASRTPWVSITEPLHPQVNAIAQCARKMGLARVIPYEVLEADPAKVIKRELLVRSQQNQAVIPTLQAQGRQAESPWADEVVREFLL